MVYFRPFKVYAQWVSQDTKGLIIINKGKICEKNIF